MMAMTSLYPPTPDSDIDITSTFQRCCSAKRVYMRKTSAAKSEASSPPVPARISRMTFCGYRWMLGNRQDLHLFLDAGGAWFERGDFFRGHGAQVGIGLGEHGARFGQTLLYLLQFAVFFYRLFDFAQGLGGLLILFVVVQHFGQRELRLQVVVPLLHLFQAIKHSALRALVFWNSDFRREKGAERCRRRAPLEEGRDGLVENHSAVLIVARLLDVASYLRDSSLLRLGPSGSFSVERHHGRPMEKWSSSPITIRAGLRAKSLPSAKPG